MSRSTKDWILRITAFLSLGGPCFADVTISDTDDTAPAVEVSAPADAGDVKSAVAKDAGATDAVATDAVATDSAATDAAPAAAPQAIATDAKGVQTELIQERYPNRAVKVERHVTQDTNGNYVNHGLWTMFDEKGSVLGRGEYRYGERHGPWTRWHLTVASEMLSQAPYKHFQPPFVSEANFENGQLNGVWTIYDSKDQKISEFNFSYGERDGKSTWYYPSGEKMREIDFANGQINGTWQEWGPNKDVVRNEVFDTGRRLAKKVETYPNGGTKTECTYLFAREVLKCNYDWWNGAITTKVEKEGKDHRHGMYVSYHKNGQVESEGEYADDLPIGKFNWWFENGQKAIEGEFDNGHQIGRWTWWHENGQKSASGDYVAGVESGKWTWWKEDGKVANAAKITERDADPQVAGGKVVEITPSNTTAAPAPEIGMPVKQQPAPKPMTTARRPQARQASRQK
jgi:antitoxin component YwqK of YwqJK toxin-antitoxin module